MSKSIVASANLCLGLVRDAFGNGLAGDAERSLRYLVLAAKGLELHIEQLNSRNDPRVAAKVREFHEGVEEQLDAFPPLDTSKMAESMAKYSAAGIESILPSMNPSDFPGLQLEPSAQPQVVGLSGEDAKRFLIGMASPKRPAH